MLPCLTQPGLKVASKRGKPSSNVWDWGCPGIFPLRAWEQNRAAEESVASSSPDCLQSPAFVPTSSRGSAPLSPPLSLSLAFLSSSKNRLSSNTLINYILFNIYSHSSYYFPGCFRVLYILAPLKLLTTL